MKNKLYKKLSLALAAVVTVGSVFPAASFTAEAETGYVTVDQLTDNDTAAPAADEVVPDANQYEYQKQELSAFCHFGPNTFNEIEWGEHYGSRTPDDIFQLEDNFDAETMVKALKEAGFKKLIVTAKHHDGFCIWNSAHTTYDVESTSYANYDYDGMGGDVLAEISAACTEYDMDMGLYLSPWDIHEPSYGTVDGDADNYNDFYNNQLEEILSNPKYGNNGHFNEVWMDGAKGSGAYAQEYDFQRWFATIQKYEGKEAGYDADCMLFGAEAYTGVRWIGNESGLSNEETWSKSVTNKTNNTINSNNIGHYHAGFSNGNQWTVPETDSRITSGWFWGNYKKTPATLAELGNRYFSSVGYNSVMLLNVPPNNEGTIDDAILERVKEFGENIAETFGTNKAEGATVQATEVRGNDLTYSPANVVDGDAATYWTVEDGTTEGSLVLDLGETTTFDVVSIEESIEFGQRITSFSVEYSNDGTNWTVMGEGSTIGAKRLVRNAPVKAQYVKITVATDDTDVFTSTSADTAEKGTVPMIAEVGVYKASEGFELASAAPDGMTVIDERDSQFTFTGSWNDEAGSQFPIKQTGKWCNAGQSFTVTFTGSKIYLIGTVDPGHGTANVSIDDEAATQISTQGSARALGQIIYESEDLEYGEHTLTLTATGTIGIDGAYVIDNNGIGMIGIEESKYTMNEDEEIQVKLIRTGGSTGRATVLLSPNPGSAIQDDYDTECITEVVFEDGETEKFAPVITRRNTNKTGDQYFTIELSSDVEGLILGMNYKARVTIKDEESLAQTPEGETFTAEDPFTLPTELNAAETLEAEHMVLNNVGENEAWPLQISENAWASGGKFVNAMNSGDQIVLNYYAAKAGTYNVTLDLRSGDTRNGLSWEEANGKVEAGSAENIGASDEATATHEAEFEIVVNKAGAGTLTFTAPQNNAPQLDKFKFELVEIKEPPVIAIEHYVEATTGDYEQNGTAYGEGPASYAIDNDPNTKWHTDWYAGANHDDHWIQVELDGTYLVEGFRYQPRQDSSPNGRITEYEILVSMDGENWEVAATGEWDTSSEWQDATFDTTVAAKYVRLQTVAATSDQSLKFASAAEIRVVGVAAPACEEHVTELVGQKDATCVEDGHEGNLVCTNCGTVVEAGEVIPAVGHEWSDWEVVKEATTEEAGLEERECATCKEKEQREIEKLPIVNPFEDVYESDYYYDSVLWAVERNITDGWTDTEFAPEMGCTRGQVVTFLWRAAGEPVVEDAENPFEDVVEGTYYYDAILWAVEQGITDGWTDTEFAPEMTCTRGQIVTFIWRAADKPVAEDAENPFEDVAENAYYYDAVLWAVEEQITDGWTDTEFAPEMTCTRGQIVTFLYRYFNSAE